MATERRPQEARRHNSVVWDCGSSLYDSFERKSLEQQLNSAIGRSQSMPHLSGSRLAPKQQPPPPRVPIKSSKISRSMHKLFRSIFRPKPQPPMFYQAEKVSKEGAIFVYDRSTSLRTIPEATEDGALHMLHSAEFGYTRRSSEFDNMGHSHDFIDSKIHRRTNSERFTSASIGISCA